MTAKSERRKNGNAVISILSLNTNERQNTKPDTCYMLFEMHTEDGGRDRKELQKENTFTNDISYE